MPDFTGGLTLLRNFFNTGETLSYQFRKKQLLSLKEALNKYEQDINDALFTDLKKGVPEVWATETGLVMSEINYALSHLKTWMQFQKISTDLLTFPSSARVYKEPLGVVLIIAPWNYPLQLSLLPLVGAMAAGNCVVVKPSEIAPATAAIITKIITETFPGNYIKVVNGEGADVVTAMMRSFGFDHVFYTGGSVVGKEIYKLAAEKLVPVTLELGGKSPCIVYDDADVTVAAKRIVLGKFLNAGQTCIAPDYVLVQEGVKEKLLNELKKVIQRFYSENASASNDYGKIINERRFDKVVSYMKKENAFYGGAYDRESLYIEPTILINVLMTDDIMQEEIFGPVLPVLSFNSTKVAMDLVLQNEKPLSFYLFTGNKNIERDWINKIQFGGGCINNTMWHFTNKHLPFGGIGHSGIGAYHGKKSFDTFTHAKPVLKTSTIIDPALKYPPFTNKLKWFKKIIG